MGSGMDVRYSRTTVERSSCLRARRAVGGTGCGAGSMTGYNIQNIATALQPASPGAEYRYSCQFHTERGGAALCANRRPFCRKLWELWSPNYRFDDAEYERTAKSFDNPDFVEVSIHSNRHRYRGRRRLIQHSTTLKSNFRDGPRDHGPYDCLAR